MSSRTVQQQSETDNLRVRVAQLRRELKNTTQVYRDAVAQHDSETAIPLLRARSQLMRQLLEAQCELLLSLRSDLSGSEPEAPADAAAVGILGDRALV